MRKKMFGNHIEPNCEYCSHCIVSGEDTACQLGRQPKPDGSCRKFSYDPLMRTPKSLPPLREYSLDDFKL